MEDEMPDITAISGLLSSLRASTELTKAMLGLRDAEMMRSKVIELQSVIMSAQSSAMEAQLAQSELANRSRELEKQIVEFENWNEEAKRYELRKLEAGTFVYSTKPGMEGTEPPHDICAACYQQRRKSILQAHSEAAFWSTINKLACSTCKAEIVHSTIHHKIPNG